MRLVVPKWFDTKLKLKVTYLFLVQAHKPIAHVVEHVNALKLILVASWRVCEVHPRYALVLPPLAEGIFIIKQRQFFNDIVHDQKSVDLRLVCHVLFVGLAELTHLVDVESLVGIYFEHASHQAT